MALIKLIEDTQEISVETDAMVRFRSTTESERDFHPNQATRIDYNRTLYVRQKPDEVEAAVTGVGERLAFGKLTLPNKWPVWFKGKGANGPVTAPPSLVKEGILSALVLGGKIQYVRDTPQEVYDAIMKAGGTPVPPIPQIMSETDTQILEQQLSTDAVWDSDIKELRIVTDSGPAIE